MVRLWSALAVSYTATDWLLICIELFGAKSVTLIDSLNHVIFTIFVLIFNSGWEIQSNVPRSRGLIQKKHSSCRYAFLNCRLGWLEWCFANGMVSRLWLLLIDKRIWLSTFEKEWAELSWQTVGHVVQESFLSLCVAWGLHWVISAKVDDCVALRWFVKSWRCAMVWFHESGGLDRCRWACV